jgi:hypothetical protein
MGRYFGIKNTDDFEAAFVIFVGGRRAILTQTMENPF